MTVVYLACDWEYEPLTGDGEGLCARCAAEGDVLGLNVERLTRALATFHGGPAPWPKALTSPQFAASVASEYARLGAKP